jgi:hypothetical protein
MPFVNVIGHIVGDGAPVFYEQVLHFHQCSCPLFMWVHFKGCESVLCECYWTHCGGWSTCFLWASAPFPSMFFSTVHVDPFKCYVSVLFEGFKNIEKIKHLSCNEQMLHFHIVNVHFHVIPLLDVMKLIVKGFWQLCRICGIYSMWTDAPFPSACSFYLKGKV